MYVCINGDWLVGPYACVNRCTSTAYFVVLYFSYGVLMSEAISGFLHSLDVCVCSLSLWWVI